MALTKAEAISANEFHHGPCTMTIGPRGRVTTNTVRVRRNGATQVWVTRPDEWRVPVKYGIRARDQFSIHHYDANEYHTAETCPLLHTYDVYVSPEHIAQGTPCEADACPIALAVKSRVPQCTAAFVGNFHGDDSSFPKGSYPDISVHTLDREGVVHIYHADVYDSVRMQILTFDETHVMQPFWFVLSLHKIPT